MYHIFFICSSVECHLGYFHVFAIINNAVMNIGMHLSFQFDFLPSDFYIELLTIRAIRFFFNCLSYQMCDNLLWQQYKTNTLGSKKKNFLNKVEILASG